MKISGVMPLRNAVRLGYPFELALASLRACCDELVVAADPTSEDDTVGRVQAFGVDRLVESPWDMSYAPGKRNEIAVQTEIAVAAASGDWVLSLQADEVLHEDEVQTIRAAPARAEAEAATGVELRRLYFYGALDRVRVDWTIHIARLFRRGRWRPNFDAMSFDPIDLDGERCLRSTARIFHYSRVGDPQLVAERVRNLDGFYHPPSAFDGSPVAPYDFAELRKLDTYATGPTRGEGAGEVDPRGELAAFPLEQHPAPARAHFRGEK